MGSPTPLSEHDQYVAGLLPQVLEFCGHEPAHGANEIAVCELCANKLIVLAGMHDDPDEVMH